MQAWQEVVFYRRYGKQLCSGQTPRNSIGSITMCLWKFESGQMYLVLSLRLAPLVLTTINILQLWSSRALTDSVYASAGYIENRNVLGVMSRQKYHSSYSGDDGHVGYGTCTLICCSYQDNMTRSQLSDYRDQLPEIRQVLRTGQTQFQPQAQHVTSDTGSTYTLLGILRLIQITYSCKHISGELGRYSALLEANYVL